MSASRGCISTKGITESDYPKFDDVVCDEKYLNAIRLIEYITKNNKTTVTIENFNNICNGLYPEKVYSYRKINLNTFSLILHGQIHLSESDTFNDPLDCALNYELFCPLEKRDRSTLLVGCVCESHDIPLMWSHYADGYRGICVEYDMKKYFSAENIKIPLYPVIYTNYAGRIRDFSCGSQDSASPLHIKSDTKTLLAMCKSKQWLYEKEWRFITENMSEGEKASTQSPLDKYNNLDCPISAIYFGHKTSEQSIEIINKIVEDKKISLYKMDVANLHTYGSEITLRTETLRGV